ncbi:MAG: tRNA lysidine(34) synthetase TilS [Candidatus Acidiferrales bacterium]
MKTTLQSQLLRTVRRYSMLRPGDVVGVAVSGGADSTALLLLLDELHDDLGITLKVLHLNHRLRGADSDGDEQFVRELAGTRHVEFLSQPVDVAAAARRRHWNLEDAARRFRYAFFEGLVERKAVTRVAVAHTADDQAETLLARILRGTGPRGLAAIHPIRGAVVRPLLEARREALREYLRAKNQKWREDATNSDRTRDRARLRHDWLPHLDRDFGPGVVERLAETSRIAAAEENFWTAMVDDRVAALANLDSKEITIAVANLLAPLPAIFGRATVEPTAKAASLALTRRIIVRLLEAAAGERARFTSRHVESVTKLAAEGASNQRVHLPHGLTVIREFDRLCFLRPPRAGPQHRPGRTERSNTPGRDLNVVAYEYDVKLPATAGVGGQVWVCETQTWFSLKLIDGPRMESETSSQGGTLDAELLRTPLILRNWRPGDAYRPSGRRSVRKLKEMFLRSRVPARDRLRWPVLTSAGRVAWVQGMPPAAEFAAGEKTRKYLVIDAEQLR